MVIQGMLVTVYRSNFKFTIFSPFLLSLLLLMMVCFMTFYYNFYMILYTIGYIIRYFYQQCITNKGSHYIICTSFSISIVLHFLFLKSFIKLFFPFCTPFYFSFPSMSLLLSFFLFTIFANVCIMHKFASIFRDPNQLLQINLKINIFPPEMFQPIFRWSIRYNKIQAPSFQNPTNLFQHLGRINIRIIRTQQSINGRFINNRIKIRPRIRHLPNIHNLIHKSTLIFLFFNLLHLINNFFRYIIIVYIFISIIVEMILKLTITTTDV